MQPGVLFSVAMSKQALSFLPSICQYQIRQLQEAYPEEPTNGSATDFLNIRLSQVIIFDQQLQIVVDGLVKAHATPGLRTQLAAKFQKTYRQVLDRRAKLAAEELVLRTQRDRALFEIGRAQAANTLIRLGYVLFLERAFQRKQRRWAEVRSGDWKGLGREYCDWDENTKIWYSAIEATSTQIWCPILKEFALPTARRTLHIASPALSYDTLEYLFGEADNTGHKMVAWQSNNALVMHERLATLFNEGVFVLVPLPAEHGEPLEWKVVVLDGANKDERLSFSGKKLGVRQPPSPTFSMLEVENPTNTPQDLHHTRLHFPTTNRPHPRYLFYRFMISVLRRARSLITTSPSPFTNPHPAFSILHEWTLPGFFMRKSMLLGLAKYYGTIIPEKFLWVTTFGGEVEEREEGWIVKGLVVEEMGGMLLEVGGKLVEGGEAGAGGGTGTGTGGGTGAGKSDDKHD